MDKRFTSFLMLVAAALLLNQLIYSFIFPPQPKPQPPAVAKAKAKPGHDKAEKADGQKADAEKAKPEQAGEKPQQGAEKATIEAAPAPEADAEAPPVEHQWGSLGSADPDSPYRMLVTWNNRGAAIERVELNSRRYHDLEERSGYLGHLSPTDAPDKKGALVRVIGPGTPAASAGLVAGDVVTAVGPQKIATAEELLAALAETNPAEIIELAVDRGGNAHKLSVTLARHPLQVIRPEFETKPVEIIEPGPHDPLSFLLTIAEFDDRELGDDDGELGGVKLRNTEWEIDPGATAEQVTFRKRVSVLDLEVTKTFRLARVPEADAADADFPAYHLELEVGLANTGDKPHDASFRLQGPTGVLVEGTWYTSKVSRTWSASGLRDVLVHFNGSSTEQISTSEIAAAGFHRTFTNSPLDYIAVDGIYFASAVIPQKADPTDVWFSLIRPIVAGEPPTDKAHFRLADVSFRLDSKPQSIAPGEKPATRKLQLFAGPKRPPLLAAYGPPTARLSGLVYYGWFWFVAQPMLAFLHFFYHVVGNYGLAIIMLTVMVRGCMFPISRRQALNAQKMQELQPEIKKIQEKYKNDTAKKAKAQQDLFRDHQYHPLSGCLPALLQLPIFVGLYKSLMVDVELRQAPLFGENVRWASNLAAPDMFWNWTTVMPKFITEGTGIFALGPYLNILPLITVALFIWQQKSFMPPPADEQAAMQQKMMHYMSVFFGLMFYKVASGLCIYFIASSIWGICERKLLPKAKPAGEPAPPTTAVAAVGVSGNGATGSAKKNRQRGRK